MKITTTPKIGGFEPNNPTPLYYQIANVIRSQIDSRELSAGDRLPSEAKLAGSFGVSTMTMRQALSILEAQGRLDRRQGVGTFVATIEDPTDRVQITIPLESVTDSVAGLEVHALSIDEVRPGSDIRAILGVAPEENCIRIRRVRTGLRGPVTYATSYLPLWLGAGLRLEDVNQSLMIDIIEARGVRFSGALQTIEAVLADPGAAAVLNVPVGAPLLLARRMYELERGQIGYVALNLHPSHEIRYELWLNRSNTARRSWARSFDAREVSTSQSPETGAGRR